MSATIAQAVALITADTSKTVAQRINEIRSIQVDHTVRSIAARTARLFNAANTLRVMGTEAAQEKMSAMRRAAQREFDRAVRLMVQSVGMLLRDAVKAVCTMVMRIRAGA